MKSARIFFVDHIQSPLVNSFHVHYSLALRGERALVFDIDEAIIDDVIGDIMYGEDNKCANYKQKSDQAEAGSIKADLTIVAEKREQKRRSEKHIALTLFARANDDADADGDGEQLGVYTNTIANSKVTLFKLCVKYVAYGTSFCMASNTVSLTNNVISTLFLQFCDEGLVSRYIRIVAAVNLQRIYDTLRRTWALSIALDSSTHQSTFYLNLRVRVYLPHCKSIENFHLMALPLYDIHMGAVMYETVVKFLDIVAPDWCVQLIYISTDGARNMTRVQQVVVTCM